VLHPEVLLHFSFILIQNELLNLFFVNEFFVFFLEPIFILFIVFKFRRAFFLKDVFISIVAGQFLRVAVFLVSFSDSFLEFLLKTLDLLVQEILWDVKIFTVLLP
jgi:hypothetical protein